LRAVAADAYQLPRLERVQPHTGFGSELGAKIFVRHDMLDSGLPHAPDAHSDDYPRLVDELKALGGVTRRRDGRYP
jgi:hypothetical protein